MTPILLACIAWFVRILRRGIRAAREGVPVLATYERRRKLSHGMGHMVTLSYLGPLGSMRMTTKRGFPNDEARLMGPEWKTVVLYHPADPGRCFFLDKMTFLPRDRG